MLVIDEAFDCWRVGKNPYDYHVAFDDWWRRDIESMVQRDRNHPSVIIWSIGNELPERDGRPDGCRLARLLADRVRQLDPTRPVTAAACGPWGDKWAWPQADGFFAALDVGGYNYEWRQYRGDHERQPQRVMMGTESFPIEAFENWQSVIENPYCHRRFCLDLARLSGRIGDRAGAFRRWRRAGRIPLASGQLRRPRSLRFQAAAVLLPRHALGQRRAALYRRASSRPGGQDGADHSLGLAGGERALDLAGARGADASR